MLKCTNIGWNSLLVPVLSPIDDTLSMDLWDEVVSTAFIVTSTAGDFRWQILLARQHKMPTL
jgi:hypothetical protein